MFLETGPVIPPEGETVSTWKRSAGNQEVSAGRTDVHDQLLVFILPRMLFQQLFENLTICCVQDGESGAEAEAESVPSAMHSGPLSLLAPSLLFPEMFSFVSFVFVTKQPSQ